MSEIRALIEEEIRLGGFPGAAWAYGTLDHVERGFTGRQTYCPESKPIDEHSVWDLASVSKVVATTTLAMRAFDAGKLDLDRPVAADIPSFGQNGKAHITPRNLLRHDAGLIAFRPYHRSHSTLEAILAAVNAEKLQYETGTKSIYSDLSMIVLSRLLEILEEAPSSFLERSGKNEEGVGGGVHSGRARNFATLVREEIARPLKMPTTGYFDVAGPTMPHPPRIEDVIPTEIVEPWRTDLRRMTYGNLGSSKRFGDAPDYIRAEVHDPTATALGGVAGHAGLFSTCDDLVAFAENMLSPKPRIFSTEARELFSKRQEEKSTRALGWDTKSEKGSSVGTLFGARSFGHTGYTGTSMWFDPEAGRFAILLTNRVHPTSANTRLLAFRPTFHDAVWRSISQSP